MEFKLDDIVELATGDGPRMVVTREAHLIVRYSDAQGQVHKQELGSACGLRHYKPRRWYAEVECSGYSAKAGPFSTEALAVEALVHRWGRQTPHARVYEERADDELADANERIRHLENAIEYRHCDQITELEAEVERLKGVLVAAGDDIEKAQRMVLEEQRTQAKTIADLERKLGLLEVENRRLTRLALASHPGGMK